MSSGADILPRFGERIRARRTLLGLSQEDVAYRCDLEKSYVRGIERGKYNPTLRVIASIAKALDTTLAALLEGL